MPISFNLVPNNIRVPGAYVEIDNTRALQGLPQLQTRILVVGNKLSTGTVPAEQLTLITHADQAIQYFGRGSQLAHMFERIKQNNRYTETWAIALDDVGAGQQASGTIAVGGTPTESGTLNIYIGGRRIRVPVSVADSAADIADNIKDAIDDAPDLPVTASVNSTTVTVTARHKGLFGNTIDMRLNYRGRQGGERTPAGVTITLTQLTGGTSNPDLTDAFDVLPDEIFDWWIIPYTDATNLDALDEELASRWGPLRMLEGHAFSAHRGTLSDLATFGNTRNGMHATVMGVYDSPTPPYEWAAAYGSVGGFHLTNDPARPLQTLQLLGVLAPPLENQFTLSERNTLLYDGVATFTVNKAGQVRIERAITTYQVNDASVPDASYLDTNTMATLAFLRQTLRIRIQSKFPRHKLADDGTRFGPGQAIVTPKVIRNEIIALFKEWEWIGLVEDIDQFKRELIVERNVSDPNRVDAQLPPNLVNQLRVFAAQIQFLL
jgi:phage tail sheath gpL-like